MASTTRIRNIPSRLKYDTTSRAFFEQMYLHHEDPWGFASSEYELGRYDATIRALSNRRYRSTFEPGCSIGVLTEQLGLISEQVHAIDISSRAVWEAQRRCHKFPHVTIKQGALPYDLPSGSFDLIVFSEVGYYFNEAQLAALMNRLTCQMQHNSVLIAVHWLGTSPDHLLDGATVHKIISSADRLKHELHEDHSKYLLDRWVCR